MPSVKRLPLVDVRVAPDRLASIVADVRASLERNQREPPPAVVHAARPAKKPRKARAEAPPVQDVKEPEEEPAAPHRRPPICNWPDFIAAPKPTYTESECVLISPLLCRMSFTSNGPYFALPPHLTRHLYRQWYGRDVPPGLVIRHMCMRMHPRNRDSRGLCVNPLHMDVGTHKDNARDTAVEDGYRVQCGMWRPDPSLPLFRDEAKDLLDHADTQCSDASQLPVPGAADQHIAWIGTLPVLPGAVIEAARNCYHHHAADTQRHVDPVHVEATQRAERMLDAICSNDPNTVELVRALVVYHEEHTDRSVWMRTPTTCAVHQQKM